MVEYQKLSKMARDNNLDQVPPSFNWIFNQMQQSFDGKLEYDPKDHPNLLINMFGRINLFITDPAAVQDMIVTKNAQIDKTGEFEAAFLNIFGRAFLFSKTDDHWKEKRKACAHAFYKDRLVQQLDVLKEQLLQTQADWVSMIDASKDGSVEIDISKEILKIFERFISQVIFGEDINHLTMPVIVRTNDGSETIRQMGVCDAFETAFDQNMMTLSTKFSNPLWKLLYNLTGRSYAFTAQERLANANCATLRAHIRNYVQKRMSGQEKSKVGNNSDILSLFLESPEVFTEDVIVDELLDFLSGAT